MHGRVLLRRIEAEEKTACGISIHDTAKEGPQESEVLAVARRDPARVNAMRRAYNSTCKAASKQIGAAWHLGGTLLVWQ